MDAQRGCLAFFAMRAGRSHSPAIRRRSQCETKHATSINHVNTSEPKMQPNKVSKQPNSANLFPALKSVKPFQTMQDQVKPNQIEPKQRVTWKPSS